MSSRDIVLSVEQRAAILTPGNLLVRAGAGSGKTEVLARRFVALLAGDIDGRAPLMPEDIAAITFTEKAAHDMRARIAAVLEERIAMEPPGARRIHLRRARRTLSLARISTIHAFCSRLLRENALEARIDPDFQVLDEYESHTFREQILKQALIAAIRRGDPGAVHLVTARRLQSASPRETALEVAMRILDEVARLGRTPQWLYEATRQNSARLDDEAQRVEKLARELGGLLDELLLARDLTPRMEADLQRIRAHHGEFRSLVLAFNAQVEPSELDFLRDLCDCLPRAQGNVGGCVASIKHLVNRADTGFGLQGELISSYGACRAIPAAMAVAETIKELASKIEVAKATERVLTFDDLLLRVRELLRVSPLIAQRQRAALRALLVDEYQDTDTIQDEIVALLATTAAAGHKPVREPGMRHERARQTYIDEGYGEEAPELFVVGDEKQSIYRFRGADVTVFGRIRSRSKPPVDELPLIGNRRSTPNIIKFVNRITAHLMHTDEQPVPPFWVEWREHHALSALRVPQIDPPVELICAIPDRPGESNLKLDAGRKRSLEARAIVTRIHQLVGELISDTTDDRCRAIEYGDVAVLFRAFTDVAIYERELVGAGVPCYTVKGRGFFACPEVLDLIEVLTAVNEANDSMALVAALRSPFFGLSDDCLAEIVLGGAVPGGDKPVRRSLTAAFSTSAPQFEHLTSGREDATRAWRILNELRTLRRSATIMAVIERALEATGYEVVMLGLPHGAQRAANLRKLVELARDFDSHQLFTFHDFVVHLRHLVGQEPYEPPAQILGENDNVVRLMTIHQAKGLEFPVVILADAGRAPTTDTRAPVVDPENGLLLHDTTGSGMDEIPNRWLLDFRERSNKEQDAESLRLLYVALTRARERLIISEGATVRGWAKQIRSFIGNEIFDSFIKSRAISERVELALTRLVLLRPQFEAPDLTRPHAVDSACEPEEFLTLARRRITFTPPRVNDLVISPTALADFDRCPRQFHFRHDLQVPEAGNRRELLSQNTAAAMGTVAHAVLQQLEPRTNGAHEIRDLVDALGVRVGLERDQRVAIAADLIRHLAASEGGTPSEREVPFFYRLGESMFVRGRIDEIIRQGNRIMVRDYKYAHPQSGRGFYQVQMETYALAVEETNPQCKIEAEVVFLKDKTLTVPIELPPLAERRARIASLARGLADARGLGEYSKKPASAGICRELQCGFVARCWP